MMEGNNYLLLARSADGYIHEKVAVKCSLDNALYMIKFVMESSPRLVRGEIIEGNRTHMGDFSIKPCMFIYRDGEAYTEQTERR